MLSVILPTLRRFFKRSIATYAAVSLAYCTQTPMSIVLSRCQQTRIARFSYLTQTDCKSPISLQLSKWTLGLHLQTTSVLTTETLGASQMSVGCSCLKPVQALQTPSTDAHTSVCKAALCNLASKDIQGLQIAFQQSCSMIFAAVQSCMTSNHAVMAYREAGQTRVNVSVALQSQGVHAMALASSLTAELHDLVRCTAFCDLPMCSSQLTKMQNDNSVHVC